MKILNKMNENIKGFKGWTHFYEDGPMVSNETIDDKYILQVSIVINNNKAGFEYRLIDTENDEVPFEHQNDILNLSYILSKLQELGDYKTELNGEMFSYLMRVENI